MQASTPCAHRALAPARPRTRWLGGWLTGWLAGWLAGCARPLVVRIRPSSHRFAIDFVAMMPWDFIVPSAKVLKLTRLLRLVRAPPNASAHSRASGCG